MKSFPQNSTLMLFIFWLFANQLGAQDLLNRQGKDYALFFAVADYEQWKDLRNPIRDAEAIARELRDQYGFETEILPNPTQAAIYSKLREYSQKSYAEDAQLFLFFSGHGHFDELTTEGFFIPRNGKSSYQDPDGTSWVAHARLNDRIAAIPCRHILLAIDACFSGTFDRRIAIGRSEEQVNVFVTKGLLYKSRLYLTSGGKEYVSDGREHSPFTRGLLTALRTDENGLVTFPELVSKLDYLNPAPRYGEFEGNEAGGNFFFVGKSAFIPRLNDGYGRPGSFGKEEANFVFDPAGNRYPTVRLAGKTWLAKNLNYDLGEGCWCYEDKPANCEGYGRLYTWDAAKKACRALGEGWRLPEDGEWGALRDHYGGGSGAYQALTVEGNSGFAALPGGSRYSNGEYLDLGRVGYYWSATGSGAGSAWLYNFGGVGRLVVRYNDSRSLGLSCRCLQGAPSNGID